MNTSFSKYVKQCKWGPSVWTQLVQITALTHWRDSPQQSRGVCQHQVRRARPRTGGDWRAGAGGGMWGSC